MSDYVQPSVDQVLDGLEYEVDRALAYHRRPRTGIQVPFHGDFVGTPIRDLGRIRWWTREIRTSQAIEKRPAIVALRDVLQALAEVRS